MSSAPHNLLTRPVSPTGPRQGFTLIELLVVMATIPILATLLLRALGRATSKALQIACLNHYRQLQLCWPRHINENQGCLPPNAATSGGGRGGWSATDEIWIAGNAWAGTTMTNIERGVLFPNNRSARIYRCPAHRSTVRDQGRMQRTRSVSMNPPALRATTSHVITRCRDTMTYSCFRGDSRLNDAPKVPIL